MDIDRARRYKDKLNLMSERTDDIKGWMAECDAAALISDKKTRLAVYKAFQELTEASFDVIAMVCRDTSIIPKDDYSNISALYDRKLLKPDIRNDLLESNGLRNRLVHRYNNLDDAIAFESITALLPGFKQFTEVINKWLTSQL